MKQAILLMAALAVSSSPLLAAQKTVTLGVPGMTCGACPIVVKKAIGRVDGVSRVDVDLNQRQAVVTYHDVRANLDQIMQATANAGYPAALKGAGK